MYETYELSRKEWGIYGAEGILGIAVMDYVFYRNAGLFLVLLPVGMLFPLMLRKQLKKRRLETLRGQFKDAILAVASGLNAGYSVENAFAVSLKEMEEIHGSDSMIAQEIRLILRKVRLNLTFEEALGDFAKRSGLDDVKNFSDVFLAARKSGGERVWKVCGMCRDRICALWSGGSEQKAGGSGAKCDSGAKTIRRRRSSV